MRRASLAIVLCAGCAPSPADVAPRNLLLIAVDTLRADHLGGYGYPRSTSPSIDRFLDRAIVFEAAQSSSSWTLPSFASLFTGHHASTHGCWQVDDALAPALGTLAERLSAAGYRTHGIVSHVFLGRRYGLDQGFETYDDELVQDTTRDSHAAITSPALTDKALDVLEGKANDEDASPWFLFVHYFDPHRLYREHPGFSEEFGTSEPVDRYDGEVAFTDAHVGLLLERLAELDLADETLVAFVADHGEEFGDHGGEGHGASLHREVLRVPFALAGPGLEPARIAQPVGTVDFTPTVLELLGVPLEGETLAGRSVARLARGASLPDTGVLSELRLETKNPELTYESIVSGRWKLIVARSRADGSSHEALFDRETDPLERRDVAADRPDRVRELRAQLRARVARAEALASELGQAVELELSSEERGRLRDLGYVGEGMADG